MSYSFVVTAKDNQLTISSQTTEVPDADYSVSGHEDADNASIYVSVSNDSLTGINTSAAVFKSKA